MKGSAAMSDVFWNGSTPQPTDAELPAAFVAVRVPGTAADGSQDSFKQMPVSAFGSGGSGSDGTDAWTAIYAAVADGSRTVLQVADWFGGSETKPAVGQYLGASGFVTDISQATTVGSTTGSSAVIGEWAA
jgi:hypothetical protein